MKKIRPRRKHFRVNTPMSFGVLCAALLILVGGATYALAAGVIAPGITSIREANASPTPTATQVLVTPAPVPTETPVPEESLTTTTDPITGEIVFVDPSASPEPGASGAPTETPVPEVTPGPLSGRTIVIDAGKSKGGEHRGVNSRTYEYLINFTFADALRQELTSLGATVVMTREDNDTVVGAKARISTINGSSADIAVSLFCNDLDNNTTRGAEAFVPSGHAQSDACRSLAEDILSGYTNATDMPTRETSEGNVRTVTNKEVLTGSKVPVMGLVLGQLSNRSDDSNLNDAAFVAKAARGIASGIRRYFGA